MKSVKKAEFVLKFIDIQSLSNFAKDISITLLKTVPRGKVITYSRLADLSGHSKAFRAVGTVMANNPFPLLIPCHRVVPSTRYPGIFMKNQKNSNHLKIQLLKLEGIKLDSKGKISQQFFI